MGEESHEATMIPLERLIDVDLMRAMTYIRSRGMTSEDMRIFSVKILKRTLADGSEVGFTMVELTETLEMLRMWEPMHYDFEEADYHLRTTALLNLLEFEGTNSERRQLITSTIERTRRGLAHRRFGRDESRRPSLVGPWDPEDEFPDLVDFNHEQPNKRRNTNHDDDLPDLADFDDDQPRERRHADHDE